MKLFILLSFAILSAIASESDLCDPKKCLSGCCKNPKIGGCA